MDRFAKGVVEIQTLPVDALIRSIAINRKHQHCLFLGAGASISSGMPSAQQCIWEWKRSIFLTKNPGLENQFGELSLPSVRQRIQCWIDEQRSFPALNAPDEYGRFIDACYPRPADRRAYFEVRVKQAVPYVGYKLLAVLAKTGLISSVWTTNFDALASRAAAGANITALDVGIDCQHRLPSSPKAGELLNVSLHGDYRYDLLKNTAGEVQEQEARLIEELVRSLKSAPTIVCGYSGRDSSILEAFRSALQTDGSHPLFWCDYSDEEPSPAVAELLASANKTRPRAFHVPGVGFDELMRRLALHVVEGKNAEQCRVVLAEADVPPVEQSKAFSLPNLPITTAIKGNAFAVTPPTDVWQFEISPWPTERVWTTIEQRADPFHVIAAPFKGRCFAFGDPQQIKAAFQSDLQGSIARVPIGGEDLRHEDTVMMHLLRRALTIGLARRGGLPNDSRELIWTDAKLHQEQVDGSKYTAKWAVLIYLRPLAGQLQLILKPTLKVVDSTGADADNEIERLVKQRILGYQHNDKFNEALMYWRDALLPSNQADLAVPGGAKDFLFSVNRTPLTALITDDRARPLQAHEKLERMARQKGLQLKEPSLIFSDAKGIPRALDVHPVRGLVSNRPYDFSLNASGITGPIRLGVICPSEHSQKLHSFLRDLLTGADPSKHEADYLPRFPGITSAFHVGLEIPAPSSPAWVQCPAPRSDLDPKAVAVTLSGQIATALAQLKASVMPSVVVVFIPAAWQPYRAFETEEENFDLHDFVKAAAVPQGVATQFLEESTLQDSLRCRVKWWLSLAFYAKAMRTPWTLDGLDPDSAYVGLGLAVARRKQEKGHLVLGCSHLYNARGQGLQFRLSRIENPVWIRRNAYMSVEDARRLGEAIRQQFFEAQLRLPKRVVIHKQTPFLKEERTGLQRGLEGIENVELVQVFRDDALRYVASKYKDGKLEVDGFPIRRGTTVVVDERAALLWVHGAATALNPRLRYYQGKRRIPAPMMIRRYSGQSELYQVGSEILGLSKMNWNSFDLYSQIPATIETSRKVARIGALLDRFGSNSHDYRLFM